MIWIRRLQAQKKGSHELLQYNMGTFYHRLYHRKCQRRGVGGQKKASLVNVVCEWPLYVFKLFWKVDVYASSIFLSCVYVGQVKMVQKITRQQVEVREATHYVHTHRQKAPNLTQGPLKVWTEHFHFMLVHWGAQTYQFLTDYRWPFTPTSDKGNILMFCKCKKWPCYFLWNA